MIQYFAEELNIDNKLLTLEDHHGFHTPPGGSDRDSNSDTFAVRCSGTEIYSMRTNHADCGLKIHGMKHGCLVHFHNIVQILSWIRGDRPNHIKKIKCFTLDFAWVVLCIVSGNAM
jgi:hypothetical protein